MGLWRTHSCVPCPHSCGHKRLVSSRRIVSTGVWTRHAGVRAPQIESDMPAFEISTPPAPYRAIVARGLVERAQEYVPSGRGKIFAVTTEDVWRHQGERLARGLSGLSYDILYLPGGEENKRIAPLEKLAGEMLSAGADRSSLIIAFGGGIVNDMAGFLAAMFMRGDPRIADSHDAIGAGGRSRGRQNGR